MKRWAKRTVTQTELLGFTIKLFPYQICILNACILKHGNGWFGMMTYEAHSATCNRKKSIFLYWMPKKKAEALVTLEMDYIVNPLKNYGKGELFLNDRNTDVKD